MNGTFTEPELIELTRTLVAIPSINPALSEDARFAGEYRLADYLADYLSRRGFIISRHEATAGRPSLVAVYGPDHPSRTLMIEAHLDTQGIHGMTVPPFEGVVKDAKIYGRGACDMKGPMASALVNLTPALLDALASNGIRVIFAAAMGEETGNLGALELVAAGVGADELLVLEPTDLHIVHAHKGAFWFEVEVQGRAAHGSNPEKGLNAITAMSSVMEMIQRQVADAGIRHPLLGRPSMNIGTIRGGSSINIVAEHCVIQVDRRTVPGEDSEAILGAIQSGLNGLVRQGVITGATLKRIKEGTPFETTSESRLVQRLARACRTEGVTPVCEGAAWYSDAGPLSRTCREVAVFGPGSIRQAHTADEYIEVAELIKGADIIHQFLIELAGESN